MRQLLSIRSTINAIPENVPIRRHPYAPCISAGITRVSLHSLYTPRMSLCLLSGFSGWATELRLDGS
jgi:hypothetical protein